jgi:FeS assembly SUF system protein
MIDLKDRPVLDLDVAEFPQVVARAGKPLEPGLAPLKDKSAIIDALKLVYDPDVGIDIYNLGLIYDVRLKENGDVEIDMSLTSPTCPIAEDMPRWAADAAATVEGVGEVEAKLVWEPMWDLSRLSQEAKYQLDMTDLEF